MHRCLEFNSNLVHIGITRKAEQSAKISNKPTTAPSEWQTKRQSYVEELPMHAFPSNTTTCELRLRTGERNNINSDVIHKAAAQCFEPSFVNIFYDQKGPGSEPAFSKYWQKRA